MSPLLDKKNIVIGITGGIAAYKIPETIRKLREVGANVRVILTDAATSFVTPLTLQAVSGHLVSRSLFDPEAEYGMGHIDLARWADIVVIAPATADIIARLASGMANDLLTTVCLATRATIAIVPAMNQQMYRASSFQRNLQIIQSYPNIVIWGPVAGSQACGDVGLGRMIEPLDIVSNVIQYFSSCDDNTSALFLCTNNHTSNEKTVEQIPPNIPTGLSQRTEDAITFGVVTSAGSELQTIAPNTPSIQAAEPSDNTSQLLLSGMSIVITAGPTQEPIDPVRYLTNHSSGKMGFSIAEAAAKLGANVTLITGPVHLPTPPRVSQRINVTTASQMNEHATRIAPQSDIFIGCAAVSDYRPEVVLDHKLKKNDDNDSIVLKLVKNPDIIANVASIRPPSSDKFPPRPYIVGFAAETNNIEKYAQSKLKRKGIDMICANDVGRENEGFNSDTNSLRLFWHRRESMILPLMSKSELGHKLMREIYNAYHDVDMNN